jgi:hypothetical protein
VAITTLDGLLAGFQEPNFFEKIGGTTEGAGILQSLLYTAGIPGSGVAPTSAIGGDALTSYPGQIPYANPGAGNGYLARLSVNSTQIGRLMIADRLWHNASITPSTTTAQTVTSATFPARDRGGTTDGDGVLVGIEVSTATTNASAVTNTTMSYTNSGGTSSRTAAIPSFPATAVAGTFVPFRLDAGDVGVRSIQSLTLGTSYAPSGSPAIHLVAYRILGMIDVPFTNSGAALDAIQLGMPRLFDNTVPFLLWQPNGSTAATIRGSASFAHG